MKIALKLVDLRNKVIKGEVDPIELMSEGIAAIKYGMQRPIGTPTKQWETLMRRVTDEPTELRRLCGLDDHFNKTRWGLTCLAYIAGNALCGEDTATATGTLRAMTPDMIVNLDVVTDAKKETHVFDDEEMEKAYAKFLKEVGELEK